MTVEIFGRKIKIIPEDGKKDVREPLIYLSLYADEAAGVYKKAHLDFDEKKAREVSSALYSAAMEKSAEKEKAKGETEAERTFAEFWAAYPAKVKKKDALSAWKKLCPDAELTKKIIDSIKDHCETDSWKRGYVPYPATYIRGEQWDDDIKTVLSAKGKKGTRNGGSPDAGKTVTATWEIMKRGLADE